MNKFATLPPASRMSAESNPCSGLTYALITPARNEARQIRQTLDAVVRQTRRPVRWMVVSDGSTDGTDDIVSQYAAQHDWIQLLRMPEHRDRSFAAKAQCFNAAFKELKASRFDVIGNLDADITFDHDYFEYLLAQFTANHRLGVAGTPFCEHGQSYDFNFSNIEHVSGACQLFRRQCFEDIGGYVPIKTGGVDWTAVTTARMKGWQTRTFVEKNCIHLKPMRTGARTLIGAIFRHGQRDYYLGGHPVWQMFRSCYQMRRPPYVIGGVTLLAGYAWALIRRARRPISSDLVRFHRREQMLRLKRFLSGKVRRQQSFS